MICPKCRIKNDDDAIFCERCGKNFKSDNTLLFTVLVVIVLIFGIVIGGLVFMMFNANNIDNDSPIAVTNTSTESVSVGKSWHKVNSYNGVDDEVISINSKGNKIKVIPSAMPIKNYDDNYLYTEITKNSYTIGSSQLSWNSKSAVATKSDTIVFSGSGTYYVYISAYELQHWNLEIWEYY